MTAPKPRNTIRTYAVIVVSITSAFIIGMIIWSTIILASPDWCGRSIGAEKASPGRTLEGLKACITLMGDQISALAWNSHIYAATIALCLLVLMVIVIAGGHISFKADKTGLSGDIGGSGDTPKSEAAKEVATAAVTKAKEIVAEEELPPMQPKP